MIYVIKKDGTREEFNSQKIVAAVNKSAARILYTFSDKEKGTGIPWFVICILRRICSSSTDG